jgi:hypothetical protein
VLYRQNDVLFPLSAGEYQMAAEQIGVGRIRTARPDGVRLCAGASRAIIIPDSSPDNTRWDCIPESSGLNRA